MIFVMRTVMMDLLVPDEKELILFNLNMLLFKTKNKQLIIQQSQLVLKS